jgi:hypothetical protein
VRRVFSPLVGIDSVFGKALQNATQLFFNRISQMTKYFVTSECEHVGDTIICSQEGISIFEFPERFLEISCIFHLFNNSNVIRILWTLMMSFSNAQVVILTVILTSPWWRAWYARPHVSCKVCRTSQNKLS